MAPRALHHVRLWTRNRIGPRSSRGALLQPAGKTGGRAWGLGAACPALPPRSCPPCAATHWPRSTPGSTQGQGLPVPDSPRRSHPAASRPRQHLIFVSIASWAALHPRQHRIPVLCLLTQELCPGLVGAERLGLLHVLGHHVEPGLGLQQAEELRGDVVLHLPPAGSQRSGPALASGSHTPWDVCPPLQTPTPGRTRWGGGGCPWLGAGGRPAWPCVGSAALPASRAAGQ